MSENKINIDLAFHKIFDLFINLIKIPENKNLNYEIKNEANKKLCKGFKPFSNKIKIETLSHYINVNLNKRNKNIYFNKKLLRKERIKLIHSNIFLSKIYIFI